MHVRLLGNLVCGMRTACLLHTAHMLAKAQCTKVHIKAAKAAWGGHGPVPMYSAVQAFQEASECTLEGHWLPLRHKMLARQGLPRCGMRLCL